MRALAALLALLLPLAAADATVTDLTSENFDALTERGFWILKFYAPWCGHCKQLAPVLDATAPVLDEYGISIGKIDATVHKDLAERYDVKGYPTMKFRRDGGELQKYPGPRTLDHFELFARRMTSPPVQVIDRHPLVKGFLDEFHLSFVFVPGAEEQPELEAVFTEVATHFQATQEFAKVTFDKEMAAFGNRQGPFIARMEKDERPRFWEALQTGAEGVEALKEWVEDQRHHTLSELGTHNFRDLGHSGRLLVVGVVDPRSKDTRGYQQWLHEAATEHRTQLPQEVFERVRFGWLDGVQWDKFVAQYNIDSKEQMPTLFVLDMVNGIFYQDDEAVATRPEALAFIEAVVRGEVRGQWEGVWGYPDRIWRLSVKWWPWSILFVVPPVLLVLTCTSLCMDPDSDVDESDESGSGDSSSASSASSGEGRSKRSKKGKKRD